MTREDAATTCSFVLELWRQPDPRFALIVFCGRPVVKEIENGHVVCEEHLAAWERWKAGDTDAIPKIIEHEE
jgi:hypothetical protein